MVEISDHAVTGSDGSTVLAILAGIGSLLLALLIFLHKKWWRTAVTTSMACCDEQCSSPPLALGKQFSFDVAETCTESKNVTCSVSLEPPPIPDLFTHIEKGLSSNSSCGSSTSSAVIEKRLISRRREGSLKQPPSRVLTERTDIEREILDNQIEDADINCNKDCIVVVDAQSNAGSETSPVSRGGRLEIALLYDAPMRKMTVHVLQARELPLRSDRIQPLHSQVRLIMLPSKKQKHKTKIKSGENPQYMESFLLHRVNPEDVNSMGLRFRVYSCEKIRRERLLGEAVVSFAHIDLQLENNLWLHLEPRASAPISGEAVSLARSDSTSSTHSVQHGGVPELLLGMAYSALTGRLCVEVVKGSHFRDQCTGRVPDTYVKLCLVSSSGQELGRSKTSVRRAQPNPLFKETFVFQVALFQLTDVTLVLSVYNRRGVTKRKEMIGWFSLGLNSSGPEELAHWKDLQQEQISRWHVLLNS